MCAVCGYTADNFWASFAIDQNGPLSPASVRTHRARWLSEWVRHASRILVLRREHGEAAETAIQAALARETMSAPSGGLFSSAYVKPSVRGYTVSSPTGVMRFCACLHTVVEQIRRQRPELCGQWVCPWAADDPEVDWALWGAAWTWNAVMNDDPRPLPERTRLTDGRWLRFEPLDDERIRVSVEEQPTSVQASR